MMAYNSVIVRVLGIETSCDETSVAIVEDGYRLLSNVVHTQIDLHAVYGGVVPEIAARSHLEVMLPTVEAAFSRANCDWDDIDAIAVTYAPGLIGSLLVGSLTARLLAMLKHKPLYPIHHVEAHVYANFITATGPAEAGYALPAAAPRFPLLALIVSGGHSQLVLFEDHGRYRLLGQTQDDAVGEAFDKVAKIIGLPYPGGPSIARAAAAGDDRAFRLPKAKMQAAYDFSFSGLKTAVLRAVQAEVGVGYDFPSHQLAARLTASRQADMAASFQRVAVETLVDKAVLAHRQYSPASVVIAGGVAANRELRRQLAERLPVSIDYPDMRLCTDNAAMIACRGFYATKLDQACDPRLLEVAPSLSM